MKKLSLLITLCILAIGIAANANMKIDDQSAKEGTEAQVQEAVIAHTSAPSSVSDPTTIGILLGVGLIGMVTLTGRR